MCRIARLRIVLLLCVAQISLCQDDCTTEEGQLEFLTSREESSPQCYGTLIAFIENDTIPSSEDLKVICTDECVGEVLKFLDGCKTDLATFRARFLRERLCSYKDGKISETSCFLMDFKSESEVEDAIRLCFLWFYSFGVFDRSQCPPPGTACSDALKTAVDTFGCCFRNNFDTDEFVEHVTDASRANLTATLPPDTVIPNNFTVNISDPVLFDKCGVNLPEMCSIVAGIESSSLGLASSTLVIVIFILYASLMAV